MLPRGKVPQVMVRIDHHRMVEARVASRHAASRHYPLHQLSSDIGDEVVVAVVRRERDLLSFSDGCNQQVGEAHCPDSPGAPQHRLHVKGAMPVLLVDRQPLIAFFAVSSDLCRIVGRSTTERRVTRRQPANVVAAAGADSFLGIWRARIVPL